MSSTRTPLIAGNWKMHKTIAEAEEFIQGLLPLVFAADGKVDIGICAPFTSLQALVDSARGSAVRIYAQNMHQAEQGAFTGEISAAMLTELEVHGVVLGHSERREYFGETDKALALKVPAALEAGLEPILCVGETEEERDNGDTERKLRHQIQEGLARVPEDQLAKVVIAYEPIWAIGTGKTATAEQAQEACAFVRALVAQRSAGRRRAAARPLRRLDEARQRGRAAGAAGRRRRPRRRRLARSAVARRDHRGRGRMTTYPRVALVVLDGWGIAPDGPGNAVSLADTPVFDALWARYPTTRMIAKGTAVGLPEGQMGNSEVGHLNLGAGAVVKQDLTRIDEAAEDGTLAENEVLRAAFEAGRDTRVHLIGLVSEGGVHSAMRHLKALIELGAQLGVGDLVIHAFTDGRDTLPKAGAGYLRTVEGWTAAAGAGRIGTVIGRYFAMDRDKRWERVQQAYDLLVHGTAQHHADQRRGRRARRLRARRDRRVHHRHDRRRRGEDPPRRQRAGVQLPPRPDARDHARARRPGVRRGRPQRGAAGRALHVHDRVQRGLVATRSPSRRPARRSTLASTLAATGAKQLHVAETEKYPHVTYFFNGGEEHPYDGERRELAQSPRDVATYDLKPEMSAHDAARLLRRRLERGPAALRHHQLRECRHGRPQRRDPRRGEGRRDGRHVPRRGRRGGPRQRRRAADHGRPRQRRPHARARRQPQHGPLAQPRAGDRHRRGAEAARGGGSSPTSHRPCCSCSARTSPSR